MNTLRCSTTKGGILSGYAIAVLSLAGALAVYTMGVCVFAYKKGGSLSAETVVMLWVPWGLIAIAGAILEYMIVDRNPPNDLDVSIGAISCILYVGLATLVMGASIGAFVTDEWARMREEESARMWQEHRESLGLDA